MDDPNPHDPELVDLVVRLCTRIAMSMEDTIPLAIHASPDGLVSRVAEVAREVRKIRIIAEAAAVLLER